ncbi:glycoside hydrolase family 127 protein [Maribellus sp. YY47]|uniref:glycoside hydrolase family 127 protein n=1 Tax=Maribellus sp. YY47 TaxID=2929486 RepID=UPI002000F73A|nr:glycoside hydrolase family 127 protein [Maribellus sp. YY47]MCK3684711.1 glycoside hydrolase family 127 protein [Maribellus sp. YY47]
MKPTVNLRNRLVILVLFCFFFGKGLIAQDKLYPNTFSLTDVRLLDGPFKHAQDLNVETLLKYDTDRFLAPFRKVAGLPEKAKNYGNWESDGLDGHVGGHYLTAMAIHYAATGNRECYKRMKYMVAGLKACQEANAQKYPDWGVGYVGAVPNSDVLWPEIKAGNIGLIWKYWVPWYNVHKTFAGLRDAWLYAGDEEAKDIFLKFCDWAVNLTSDLTDNQMEDMLANEHGGMNEVLADAYQLTSDEKYLVAAKRFSHKEILKPMSEGIDSLDNKHANTQVPKAVGFERIAEVSGDESYDRSGSFFWETVTKNRSLALGGNSRREFFPTASACNEYVSAIEGPESCNTNNMLKLTEVLFRMHPQEKYTDFYERALFNHILSSQHPEHGGYVYFTPARPRHYRVYSAPNEAMWCCVGTGMENHGKYGEFIYTHSADSLFLNLFIASELNWKAKGVKLKQETRFPYEETTMLTITEGKSNFKLMVRYPAWVEPGKLEVKINGSVHKISAEPASYFAIDRKWKKGDVVEVSLPMQNRIEELPNVSSYIALLHGPILLGAKTRAEDLKGLIAGSGRWEHIAGGKMLPVDKAPIIVEDNREKLLTNLDPVEGKPLHFKAPLLNIVNTSIPIEFEPFYSIHDSRYMMYWLYLSNAEYQLVLDSLAKVEEAKLALEERTTDKVQPGQQQPEADHYLKSANSTSGNYQNEFWRDARSGGFFSYQLNTAGETDLSLIVRYWGNETSNRTFDILIDDEKLATENTRGKWKVQDFREVEYSIPASMLEGKSAITLKFQPHEGSVAGGIFFVRLVKNR